MLHKSSRGIPRVVNILSHKAMLVAYGRGNNQIDHAIMRVAVKDTDATIKHRLFTWFKYTTYILIGSTILAAAILLLG